MFPIKAKGSSSAAEGGGEKMLRAMQLIDPDIDPEAVFATSAAADDTLDEDGLAADEDDQPGVQFIIIHHVLNIETCLNLCYVFHSTDY